MPYTPRFSPTEEQQRLAKKQALIERIKEGSAQLRGCPSWYNDKDVVLAAVQRDGTQLKDASTQLRLDPDVVRAAVQQNGEALYFANSLFRQNRSIVLDAIRNTHKALNYVHPTLRADPEIAIIVLLQNPEYIELIDQALCIDPAFVILCIQQGVDTDKLASFNANFALTLQAALRDHLPTPAIQSWSADHIGPAIPKPLAFSPHNR